jgi:hypothetical protein
MDSGWDHFGRSRKPCEVEKRKSDRCQDKLNRQRAFEDRRNDKAQSADGKDKLIEIFDASFE